MHTVVKYNAKTTHKNEMQLTELRCSSKCYPAKDAKLFVIYDFTDSVMVMKFRIFVSYLLQLGTTVYSSCCCCCCSLRLTIMI